MSVSNPYDGSLLGVCIEISGRGIPEGSARLRSNGLSSDRPKADLKVVSFRPRAERLKLLFFLPLSVSHLEVFTPEQRDWEACTCPHPHSH